jgi:hypothetical protein
LGYELEVRLMDAAILSILTSACVFAGALLGLFLHRVLPEPHLSRETQDVVKLGAGMMSVLSSLLLALLITRASNSHQTTDHQLRSYAANLILLDQTLQAYGQNAAAARNLVRHYTTRALQMTWSGNGHPAIVEDKEAEVLIERVREAIRALMPADEGQQWLKNQALQISGSLLQQRWVLIEEQGASVQPAILVVLISWIMFIFASFGLQAPLNTTVVVTFIICSLGIGGSVFLILEMDTPFTGILAVSKWPMENALAHMNP